MAAAAKYEAMDPTERALFVAKVMAALGLTGIALALLGEYLGWWSDFGEALGVTSIIATGIAGAVAVLVTASRGQVGEVGEKVEVVGDKVETVGEKVDNVGANVDAAHHDIVRRQDQQTDLLRQIRDRLPPGPASQP